MIALEALGFVIPRCTKVTADSRFKSGTYTSSESGALVG